MLHSYSQLHAHLLTSAVSISASASVNFVSSEQELSKQLTCSLNSALTSEFSFRVLGAKFKAVGFLSK